MRCLTSEKTESPPQSNAQNLEKLLPCGSETGTTLTETVCETDRNTQKGNVMLSVVMLSDALKNRWTAAETNVVVLDES